jgi:hypothetical protein
VPRRDDEKDADRTVHGSRKSNAPCDGKTADVAYILIANKGDVTEKSHNQGKYYAYIRVTDDDIKLSENANPVKTLRLRYDAWKKAGSKPFSTVPTVASTTN